MKNVFVIHSYNGDTELSFAPSIEKICKKNNIKYFFPHFPLRQSATYEGWEEELNKYRNHINENTIIIAHSLGTHFVPKYLAKNNIKINAYISVAGFLNYKGREDLERIVSLFIPTEEEFFKCRGLVNKIYSFYSDNDELNSISNLESYANILGGQKMLINGYGHFGSKSGVTEVEDINNIILK